MSAPVEASNGGRHSDVRRAFGSVGGEQQDVHGADDTVVMHGTAKSTYDRCRVKASRAVLAWPAALALIDQLTRRDGSTYDAIAI